MDSHSPFLRDLVLVGGGHAHVQVLRKFGMKPVDGVRLTVVSRESHSPYSGMLPGHVAGEYSFDDIHIDLMRMCTYAQARFICDHVTNIDADSQKIEFATRPSIRYDLVSVNVGGALGAGLEGRELVVPVKPIAGFLPSWIEVLETHASEQRVRVAIVGGGPGSVELALSIAERHGKRFTVDLITAENTVLVVQPKRAQTKATAYLKSLGVEIVENFRVEEVEKVDRPNGDRKELRLRSSEGLSRAADVVLWVTGVNAPQWLADSTLKLDDSGFIEVNEQLQSTSHRNVFAAGDVASLIGQQRPKSGVFAVRQGPVLTNNLRASLFNRKLKRYRAQRFALAILRMPQRDALACKGPLAISGRWIRWVKDRIDRRFMKRFQAVKFMDEPSSASKLGGVEVPQAMRCGGCGAKLSADLLQRVLHRLRIESSLPLSHLGDDAAIVNFGSAQIATSCDSFRSMISDPWRFGRIAAHHALNDIYAMGGEPKIALALATVPLMATELMEEDLFQMMSGALAVFEECGVELVGGHSAEGAELTLGFAVSGSTPVEPLMKQGMLANQTLVVTKPIGTGVILAGAMRGEVPARLVLAAVECMDHSNAIAADIFLHYRTSALTDITGFGLAGHLAEMMRASSTDVELHVEDVPLLEGAYDAMDNGIASSLQLGNEMVFQDCEIETGLPSSRVRLLADPQTCGGLMGSVPNDSAEECLRELKERGYSEATIVGRTLATNKGRMLLV